MTGAVFAFDGLCRLLLERGPSDAPRTAGWLMCNPSRADAEHDDPTVKRVIHHSARVGCDRALVGNVWSRIATDPADLWGALARGEYTDAMNSANLDALAAIGAQCDVLFMAFGAEPARRAPGVVRSAINAIWDRERGVPVCLGMTGDDLPLHPLARGKMAIRRDATLYEWDPDRYFAVSPS